MAILTSFHGKSHAAFCGQETSPLLKKTAKAATASSSFPTALYSCRDFNLSSSSTPLIRHADHKRSHSENPSLEETTATESSSSSNRGTSAKRGTLGGGWWWACLLLSLLVILSSTSFCGQAEAKHAWERPGCHKVGHTRKVTIPECVEFTITTNACRGYCESFAVPSAWYRLQNNPSQAITSVGQCCNIMETEDVTVNVMCVEGQKELVFKSAKSCACYHCKKD